MELFAETEQANLRQNMPLAVRMRPRSLDEFVGQDEFVGEGKLLWRMLQADRLTSLIFFGPPGTGKTSMAGVIAQQSSSEFVAANAASIGVKEIRIIIQAARDRLATGGRKTVLFLDEIHRFSRTQQRASPASAGNDKVTITNDRITLFRWSFLAIFPSLRSIKI